MQRNAIIAAGGNPMLAFIGGIGPWEIIIIGGIALLIFGGRLPQVGKNLGKGIVEFKKGLKGIEDDIDEAANRSLKEANARVKEEEEKKKEKEEDESKES